MYQLISSSHLPQWVPEIRHHCPTTPMIIAGNKIDLRYKDDILAKLATMHTSPITKEEGFALAATVGAHKYMEYSALTSEGLAYTL